MMHRRSQRMREVDIILQQIIRKYKQEMNKIMDDFSILDFHFMKLLSDKNVAWPVTSIAHELSVSPIVISANAVKLEQKGLLARKRVSADKRVVQIGLTKDGRKRLTDLEKRKQDFLMAKYKHFSLEEIETMHSLLKQLLTGAKGLRNEEIK